MIRVTGDRGVLGVKKQRKFFSSILVKEEKKFLRTEEQQVGPPQVLQEVLEDLRRV